MSGGSQRGRGRRRRAADFGPPPPVDPDKGHAMSIRRLPVYLLIDSSESMAGPAIEAVSRGVTMLVNELRGNPLALESAYPSIITFAKQAQQVVPLTELLQFTVPKFSV